MVAQSPLATVVFAPQHLFLPSLRPHHLALEVLHTLYHLSFIIAEFGGISPESNSFTELKRITYLALDILTQEPREAEAFVAYICSLVGIVGDGQRRIIDVHDRILSSKKSFALVCLEQLVPVLGSQCIRDWVWEMCYPYLSDTLNREIYESAHSVILAILASHTPPEIKGIKSELSNDFVTRIIPFYAQCLIENSGDGKLSTTQLQLAYSALVQSAANHNNTTNDAAALAWYCIETLTDAIRELSDTKTGNEGKVTLDAPPATQSHLHRLYLTLIATVPSLPLPLMLPVLDKIRDFIILVRSEIGASSNERGHGRKAELVDALFREILERVGDMEKETAMGWWYANLEKLRRGAAVRGRDGER